MNILKMLKHSRIIISCIIGVLIGVCVSLLIKKYSSLYIQSQVGFEINPLEIFSILINVFLAIYITRNLSKLNDLEKTEKELIIGYIKDYKSEFSNKINKLLEQGNFESPITNSNFKILRTRISSILNLATEHNFIIKSDETVVDINKKITEIWEFFTDAPKKVNPKSPNSVKVDIERINLEKTTRIETSTVELEKLLFQLIIKINKK
ncbi:hypothetical protein [Flavobacterium sp. XGLA_31]|uniref:hypothetical protein n=1 Tax=Flavobacterium sp. XGLA_31 TaxID=3447666 RepID=UPI003F36DB12